MPNRAPAETISACLDWRRIAAPLARAAEAAARRTAAVAALPVVSAVRALFAAQDAAAALRLEGVSVSLADIAAWDAGIAPAGKKERAALRAASNCRAAVRFTGAALREGSNREGLLREIGDMLFDGLSQGERARSVFFPTRAGRKGSLAEAFCMFPHGSTAGSADEADNAARHEGEQSQGPFACSKNSARNGTKNNFGLHQSGSVYSENDGGPWVRAALQCGALLACSETEERERRCTARAKTALAEDVLPTGAARLALLIGPLPPNSGGSFYVPHGLPVFFAARRRELKELVIRLHDAGGIFPREEPQDRSSFGAAWTEWVCFFLAGVAESAEVGAAQAKSIGDLYNSLTWTALELTRSRFAAPVVDAMFAEPVFKPADFAKRPNMPTRAQLSKYFTAFREAGMVTRLTEGRGSGPEVLALAPLLHLCEDFDR